MVRPDGAMRIWRKVASAARISGRASARRSSVGNANSTTASGIGSRPSDRSVTRGSPMVWTSVVSTLRYASGGGPPSGRLSWTRADPCASATRALPRASRYAA